MEFPNDFTLKWKRDPNIDFLLDLDEGAFCGVRFGDPVQAFQSLGSAESFQTMYCSSSRDDSDNSVYTGHFPQLKYVSDGFMLTCTPNLQFVNVFMVFTNEWDEFIPFPHEWKLQNRRFRIDGTMSPEHIEKVIGIPNAKREYPKLRLDDKGYALPPTDDDPLCSELDYLFSSVPLKAKFNERKQIQSVFAGSFPRETEPD